MDNKKKQYGLVLKKDSAQAVRKVAAVFAQDDDDDGIEKVDVSYSKESASTIRTMKTAERMHERALAEDPSIFNYDASYDDIQAEKNEKIADQKAADKERKSKYAEAIIKTHKRREIEKQSREERQQQKERVKEGEEFADKETFVTGAYRKQMEAVEDFRKEEAYEARFNELTSVEKQKVWQAGLSRTLLNDIARTGIKKEVVAAEKTTEDDKDDGPKKKERHIRKRMDSRSPSPVSEKKKDDKATKKSIYSDDEDDAPAFRPPPKAAQKNFEGELKPGLNRVVKKSQTNVDKLRERQFTPTPPSSDDESQKPRRRVGRDHADDTSRKSDDRRSSKDDVKPKIEKLKKAAPTKEDKDARLLQLKDILKQRNGPEQIEEFRQRYLERRMNGTVVPPL